MRRSAETRLRRSRDKILAAAERVFLAHGFPGTNMDGVAEAASVSKQTVYAHFRSKEALFVEVVGAMTGAAATALGEDVAEEVGALPVEAFLGEAARAQLAVVMTPRLMRLRRMVIGEVERFPELGRALHACGPQASIARYARAFAAYRALGQLRLSDPLAAATQFNWILMGAPTNAAMLLGDAGIPPKADLDRHAAESVRIFLAAYGTACAGAG